MTVTDARSPAKKAALAITGLTVDFGGAPVLSAVDLVVPYGGFVGLVGPNGAGKTTLINCVSGLVKASEGTVEHAGQDVLQLAPHQRVAVGIGRTFQQAQLLDGLSCLDNVLLGGFSSSPWLGWFAPGRRTGARATAREALAAVGLEDMQERIVTGLPFGVRRRVDLARALAMQPTTLLLDEPLSGLSGQEREDMSEMLSRLPAAGVSVLMVEHDVDQVRRLCSTIIVLDYGVTLAVGPPSVLDLPAVGEAYLGILKEEM